MYFRQLNVNSPGATKNGQETRNTASGMIMRIAVEIRKCSNKIHLTILVQTPGLFHFSPIKIQLKIDLILCGYNLLNL